MALTDHCDLYAAVHEDGVNRAIEHLMLQRPSLFNYATTDVAKNRKLWCHPVRHTPDVTKYGNPLFTELSPLPVIGADSPPVTVGFIVQVVAARIDFYPGNVISLPPELGALKEQQFSLALEVCGGIACPAGENLEAVPVLPPQKGSLLELPKPPPVHVPGRVQCFCLKAFVTGHVARELIGGQERVLGVVDGVEIVDIEPRGLEESIECYLRSAITLVLRQKLAIPLATFFIDIPLFGSAGISLAPTPNPPVPHNPAVEEDQVKIFVTMSVIP